MTAEQQHLARLRDLQRRYDCADNVGNEDGCQQIQKLIDAENERWADFLNAKPMIGSNTKHTKGK